MLEKSNRNHAYRFIVATQSMFSVKRMLFNLLSFPLPASEVRSWLLYYSLPVLKDVLPDQMYCHYALLATSVYQLLQQPVTQSGLLLADRQLEEFYGLMSQYYGIFCHIIVNTMVIAFPHF